ncbi:MAG: XRE family transcriptional regulator [Rubrivivax sp.]|nr:XRE family transcriptional regulator [Rubrivivax sp.]
MAATEFAPINPHVLAWARKEGGWLPDQVAQNLHVKPDRVAAWESGDRKPTVRHVENLARFLHRPLSIFFLPSPPDLPPLATEYRRLSGVTVGAESPQLRLALRQMLNRREYALNLYEERGEAVPAFDAVAHLSASAASVGERLRARLGVAVENQIAWTSEWQAWRGWRAAVEAAGVLVFQFNKVALEETRGLTLLDTPLPVVGINSKERVPEAKAFTLLHEVVHLMLAAGNEERPAIQERRSDEQWAEVERFAESAASHALVPEAALRLWVDVAGANDSAWTTQDVRRLARRFWITPLAMATRLRESGFMNWNRYNEWRGEWNQYVSSLPARAGGFATPAEKAMNRHGRPFVQWVLEAMSANRITSVDAARYLELKFQHFDQLRELVSGPGTGAAASG